MIDLSILILAKQEAENLSLLLPAIECILEDTEIRYEIIVVMPGVETAISGENFPEVRYLTEEKEGYGNALKQGFENCSGTCILTVDADLSHPPDYIAKLWENRDTADLLVCSRYTRGGKANMPFVRKLSSRLLNLLFSKSLMLPIKDISSGYRLYRRDALKGIRLTSHNFDILIEIAIRMYLKGLSIREIPFEYRPRRMGSSKARLMLFAFSYIKTYSKMFILRYLTGG